MRDVRACGLSPFHRADKRRDEFANPRRQIRLPGVLADSLHNGAADDDAIRDCRDLARLFRSRNPEADRDRQFCMSTDFRNALI